MSKGKANSKPAYTTPGDWPAWLANMSVKTRKQYFADHPNSKYHPKRKSAGAKPASKATVSPKLAEHRSLLADAESRLARARNDLKNATTDKERRAILGSIQVHKDNVADSKAAIKAMGG